jgi:glycosyltransferase involved in cell wall biosynthesis
MNICIVIDDYMPHSIKIGAKMMHELACEFVSQGHEVSVITPSAKQKETLVISKLDGVTVCNFLSGEIKNVGKVKRAINETLLPYYAYKSTKKFIKENPHDLIVYYSPTIFFGSFVKKLKQEWNAKSYLVLRDIFPQWTIDNGLLKENSIITKYFKYFEKINYENADKIGLMSQKNLEWFNEQNSNKYSTELLHNWTTTEVLKEMSRDYRKKLGLENKIIYFYGGNMGHAQDMLNLMRLARNMKEYDNAHFLFVGVGDEVELIKEFKEQNDLVNTTILGSVNQVEFKKILSEIDVGLFSLNANHKTHNFPGKLLGYMSQNKPILGSINPNNDLKDIVEEYNAGYISVNGEDKVLFENAVKLLDATQRDSMGKNAKKLLISHFSVEAAAAKILK